MVGFWIAVAVVVLCVVALGFMGPGPRRRDDHTSEGDGRFYNWDEGPDGPPH